MQGVLVRWIRRMPQARSWRVGVLFSDNVYACEARRRFVAFFRCGNSILRFRTFLRVDNNRRRLLALLLAAIVLNEVPRITLHFFTCACSGTGGTEDRSHLISRRLLELGRVELQADNGVLSEDKALI